MTNAIGDGIRIKVTTEQLRNTAEQVRTVLQKMSRDYEGISNAVRRTENYWIGQAGDFKRDKYYNSRDVMEDILDRLTQYPTDLLSAADVYESAEDMNIENTSGLTEEVIT